MKLKIFLEEGESQEYADEIIEKAFNRKHEHSHTEEFQDPLMEELLDEFDREIKMVVFLGGFQEAMQILTDGLNVDR